MPSPVLYNCDISTLTTWLACRVCLGCLRGFVANSLIFYCIAWSGSRVSRKHSKRCNSLTAGGKGGGGLSDILDALQILCVMRIRPFRGRVGCVPNHFCLSVYVLVCQRKHYSR